MSLQDGAIFQAMVANNRTGRLIRTSGAILFIIGCSLLTGIKILGPMLANSANIRPGAVYTVQAEAASTSDKIVEPKAPPLEISSKTDPDMIITPVALAKKKRQKRKAETSAPAPPAKKLEEIKTIVPPPPADADTTDPDTNPPKPDPKVDGDPGKTGN